MNEHVPDGSEGDELPEDEQSSEQYREAAEATLQRLMAYLKPFGKNLPLQTSVTDLDDPHLTAGARYSVPGSDKGAFEVCKVLLIDEFGVHLRLYGNSFSRRPATVAPEFLDTSPFFSLAPEDAGHEWPLSVGHLPLMARTFLGMHPVYIAETEVEDDELDDYREWKEAGGGYL